MTTARVKQLLALGIGIGAVVAAAILLGRLGDVVEATGSGADPENGFTAAVSVVDPAAVRWDADAADLFRPVDDGVRQAIAEAYLSAVALLDGDPAMAGVDPSAYLTGPALSAIGSASSVTVDGRHHTLAVMFHSADGQIVELVDRVRMMLVVGDDGRLSLTETAVVVMVQVDGTWHLRHRVVNDSALQRSTVSDGRSDSR